MAANIGRPALERTFKSVKYTCKGEGLLKNGHPYESKLEKFLPPKTIKAGAEPKEPKPAAWWKAQCAFRGLNQTGAIADLQMRLRESKAKMLPELKEIERDLNKQIKKDNKPSKKDSWHSKSASEKAEADASRYLDETFPANSGRPVDSDVVVLYVYV